MPDQTQAILHYIQSKGPVLPIDIAKFINSDMLIASAYLSSLTSENKILLSSVKVGGSPLYYVKGQEARLLPYISRLHEKDQKALEMLQKQKVLRDKDLDILYRVGFRKTKDFAIPLQVKIGENAEIFWKWYLTSDEEAKEVIMGILNPSKPIPIEKPKEEFIEIPLPAKAVEEKPKVEEKLKAEERQKTEEKPKVEERPRIVAEQKREEKAATPIQKEEKQIPIQVPIETPVATPIEAPKKRGRKKKEAITVVNQQTLPETQPMPAPTIDDPFFDKIKKQLESEGITIKESTLQKKNSEVDLVVSVPTPVGKMDFYCKAKNKKKINDGDLSTAFVQGQLKKLPVLFITTGEVSKKAEQMLQREFNGMKIKKI